MTEKQSFFLQLLACAVLVLAIFSFESEAKTPDIPTLEQQQAIMKTRIFKEEFDINYRDCILENEAPTWDDFKKRINKCTVQAYDKATEFIKGIQPLNDIKECIAKARKAAHEFLELAKKACIHPDLKVLDTGCIISKKIQIRKVYEKDVRKCKSESN